MPTDTPATPTTTTPVSPAAVNDTSFSDKAKTVLDAAAAKGKASYKVAETKALELAKTSKEKSGAIAAKAGAGAKAHPVATTLAVLGVAGLAFALLNSKSRKGIAKTAGLALIAARRKGEEGSAAAVDMADWATRKAKKLRRAA